MSEDPEVKRVSKLSSLIGQAQANNDGMQIYVHYSENNWETSEEINLILSQNSTIDQLIEASINKFKTELFYDNIDKKKFCVRIFKKKKKIPNMEYPVCNPNSKIGNYGKTHFCLVEEEEEENKKNDTGEEIILEEKKENINDDKNKKEIKNENKQNSISSDSNNISKRNQKTDNSSNIKSNKPSCRPCIIF